MKKVMMCLLSFVFLMVPCTAFARGTAYEKARVCYYKEAKVKGSKPQVWDKCIKLFEDAAKGEDEEAALYSAARLRRESLIKFKRSADKDDAIRLYNEVIKRHPKGKYADDALFQIGCLREDVYHDKRRAKKAFSYLIENYPDSKYAGPAKRRIQGLGKVEDSLSEGPAFGPVVEPAGAKGASVAIKDGAAKEPSAGMRGSVRQPAAKKTAVKGGWAGPRDPATLTWEHKVDDGGTSVIFHLDRKTRYTYYKEPYGPRTKALPKLIVNFPHTDLADGVRKGAGFKSGLASKMKLSEPFLQSRVKVVLYLEKGAPFSVNQSRYDVIVRIGKEARAEPVAAGEEKTAVKKSGSSELKIMIDPGHGGRDPGAVGFKGSKEKNIVLAVAKQLKWYLKKNLGAKVKLTRWNDKYLTLEERNKMAEKWGADIFISLHVNASTNKEAKGIETYFLNNTTNKAAMKLARRENKYSGRSLADTEKIILTMLQNYSAEESKLLAQDVQSAMVKRLGDNYKGVDDHGTKGAMFYVLVGARCPGVIVEMSYVSNPLEERRLEMKHYQSHLALGIAEGVGKYLDKNPAME